MKDRISKGCGSVSLTPFVLTILIGLIWAAAAMAGPKISGTASVWAYARDDSVEHVQAVPQLSFVARDCVHRDLHFEGSVRGFADFRHDKAEDRQLRLLRAVFVYEPRGVPWEFRLGQQWLSEGVARGNVAGAWVRHRWKKSSVTLFGGSRPQTALSVQEKNPLQGYAAGLHARTRVSRYNLGASYFYVGKGDDLLYHAAGVDAAGRVRHDLTLRARLEMNLEQSALERGQLLAQWRAREDLQVSAELRTQTPRIFEDSFFTIFLEEASTTYMRASARWAFYRSFYAKAGGMTLFSEHPDPLYKVRAALGHPNLEVGYTHWLSVAKGVMDGLYAQASYRFGEKYDAFGGYDFSRGSNADPDLRATTQSHAAYLGGAATPIPALTFSLRVEQVRDLQRSDDWRGLLGITTRFSNLR